MSETIDVAFTPDEIVGSLPRAASVVVIDVVRASTTIVAALTHGARGVVPVGTPEEGVARLRASPAGSAILGGERGGIPLPGFQCGNSPVEYTAERVGGRTVVFTTTNGTRALLAVASVARVAVGGFVNAAAVVRWLARVPGGALLVCAGELGRFCLEDATCAGLLAARLRTERPHTVLSDGARAAEILYAHYRDDLSRVLDDAAWARVLAARGQGADLPPCVGLDTSEIVPIVRDGTLVVAEPENRRVVTGIETACQSEAASSETR